MTTKPTLQLSNTMTRRKEDLGPPGKPVLLYTCGPTVYNYVHVGNWRAFLFYDVLRRSLEWLGYPVRHTMNITDIDDKTIRGAQAEKTTLAAFTGRYTDIFLADLKRLSIVVPHEMPRATAYIPQMIELVQRLLRNGAAYRSEDGSIYFKIEAFEPYGALSRLDTRTLEAGKGGRVAVDEYEKESVHDFALWKAWAPEDGDVVWDTPFGRGRPGWHLECSAMAFALLGETIDIHAGGIDLVFPHHENEIAQSEAASGRCFSRFWVHNEHLLVGGQKMSKRLKNFFTLQDLERLGGATPREVRYALIAAHYKAHLNLQVTFEGEGEARRPVKFDSLVDAKNALRRLDQFRKDLKAAGEQRLAPEPARATAHREALAAARETFTAAIADDLNVPRALSALFDLITAVNKAGPPDRGAAADLLAFWSEADGVLGVLTPEADALAAADQALFDAWKAARDAKDWKQADEVRAQLGARGIQVQAKKGAEASWTRA